MNKYIVWCDDDAEVKEMTIEEAREKVKTELGNPNNFRARGIYKLIEVHEKQVEFKVTKVEDVPTVSDKALDISKEPTMLEVVRITMPDTHYYDHGCPWATKFKEAFESQGYKHPQWYDCNGVGCPKCWKRKAERL